MRATRDELPVVLDTPQGKIHMAEWGEMCAERGAFSERVDPEAFFKGLPDDRCQCPHWGYVIKGQLRYKTAHGEEVFSAGDSYYIAPGHTPVLEAGVEYVEFSPKEEIARTAEVVMRNVEAMQAAAH